jgi:hypothetical protein
MIELLRRVSHFVGIVPEQDEGGQEVRCHELARAVQSFLSQSEPLYRWEVCDGKFLRLYDHSWLELTTPRDELTKRAIRISGTERVVLDVYAIGAVPQVQMVYQSALMDRFQRGAPREDIRHDVVTWLGRWRHL